LLAPQLIVETPSAGYTRQAPDARQALRAHGSAIRSTVTVTVTVTGSPAPTG
jgi:hypothetical protein